MSAPTAENCGIGVLKFSITCFGYNFTNVFKFDNLSWREVTMNLKTTDHR